jgi:hypothetical protein
MVDCRLCEHVAGPTGPTWDECKQAYARSLPHENVTVDRGIQTVLIPTAGLWTISVYGAGGGRGFGSSRGGRGALARFRLTLEAGEALRVVVGAWCRV